MNIFREDNKKRKLIFNVTVPSIDTANYGKLFANIHSLCGVENLIGTLGQVSDIFNYEATKNVTKSQSSSYKNSTKVSSRVLLIIADVIE